MLALLVNNRNFAWVLLSQIIAAAANFIFAIIILRQSGLEIFGQFSILFLTMMISRSLLVGLVLNPMSVINSKLSATSLPTYNSFLFLGGTVFCLLLNLVVMAILLSIAAAQDLQWIFEAVPSFIAANLISGLVDFLKRFHLMNERNFTSFILDSLRYIVQLIVAAVIVGYLDMQLTTVPALWVIAAGALPSILFQLLQRTAFAWRSRFCLAVWPRHRNFLIWMTPAVLLETVQIHGPLMISGGLLGGAQIGLVRALQQLSNIVNLPLNALQQFLPSASSKLYRHRGSRAMFQFLGRITIVGMLFLVAVTIALYAEFELIVSRALGIHNPEALWVLMTFLLSNALVLLRIPLLTMFQVFEMPKAGMLSSLVGAVMGLLLIVPACHLIGAVAVPVVNCLIISTSIAMYCVMYFLKRHDEGVSL